MTTTSPGYQGSSNFSVFTIRTGGAISRKTLRIPIDAPPAPAQPPPLPAHPARRAVPRPDPEGPRAALEKLRRTIRAAAPEATECVSYRLPAFRHHGVLVSYGAAEKHCALSVMSPAVMKAHARELETYDTSAGTVRFRAEKPLPAALVRKLVRARMAENEAARRSPERARPGRPSRPRGYLDIVGPTIPERGGGRWFRWHPSGPRSFSRRSSCSR